MLASHSHWYYVIPQSSEKIYEERVIDTQLKERFSHTFNVVFTGNIRPAQSFPTMVEAANILSQRAYSAIRWIVVGDRVKKRSGGNYQR